MLLYIFLLNMIYDNLWGKKSLYLEIYGFIFIIIYFEDIRNDYIIR